MLHQHIVSLLLAAMLLSVGVEGVARGAATGTESHYSVISGIGKEKKGFWAVRRFGPILEIQQQQSPVSMVWSRSDTGLERWELLHRYRTAIHYSPVDDRITERAHLALLPNLFDGTARHRLPVVGDSVYITPSGMEYSVREYHGSWGGVVCRLLWIDDLSVSARIELQADGRYQQIDLVETGPSTEPAMLLSWRDEYDDLEFADLGDNEAHPAVKELHQHHTRLVYPEH